MNTHPRHRVFHGLVHQLHVVRVEPNLPLTKLRPDLDHHCLPRLQQVPVTAERLGQHHHLELSSRVRQGGVRKLLSRLRGSLLSTADHAGHAEGRVAGFRALDSFRRQHHTLAAHHLAHVFERMSCEIKADGGQFLVQLLRSGPWLDRRQARPHDRTVSKQTFLSCSAISAKRLGVTHQNVGRRQDLSPVRMDPVKGPCPRQIFQGTLVQYARIDAFDEIKQIGIRPARGADLRHVANRFDPHIAHRAECVEHAPVLHIKIGA